MRNAVEVKRYVGLAVFWSLMLCASAALAVDPQQYATVSQMIEDKADFSEELGTFKVLSKEPLHIQLAAQVVADDLPDVVLSEVRRAAIYGVYRTLIHTSADKVWVTAVPMEVTLAPYSARMLDTPTVEIMATREQALKAVADKTKAESLHDLVAPSVLGNIQIDSWAEPFEVVYRSEAGQKMVTEKLSLKEAQE